MKLEASRRKYEEKQKALDAEYEERVRKEREALEEARRLEKERREEEEKQRQLELQRIEEERKRKEMFEKKAREVAAASRKAERKKAEKEMSRFAVRMEGTISLSKPPPGTMIAGPLEQEAAVRLSVRAGSLIGGYADPYEIDFPSFEETEENAHISVANALKKATDGVVSALELQAMSGDGAFALMEEPEKAHWMSLVNLRSSLSALAALDSKLRAISGANARLNMEDIGFQCRTESGVLPADHPFSYQSMYGKFLNAILEGSNEVETINTFLEYMEEANNKFYDGLEIPLGIGSAPRQMGACLEIAHFIDRILFARPSKESDAPAWFETCVEFSRQQVRALLGTAQEDSLEDFSNMFAAAVGPNHPIVAEVARLALKNTSQERKILLEERDRLMKSKIAAKLLEEEWPDEEEIRKARAEDREAKTPVAERIWALKNVAGTLSMGSKGELSRARQLLEQAVLLKQQVCGEADHAAVFPEAISLFQVIRREEEWRKDASGLASLLLRILMNISSGYQKGGDSLSAAVVLEYGLRQCEDAAGLKNQATTRAVRTLEKVLPALDSAELNILSDYRGKDAEIEDVLRGSFTDQLGAYQDGTERHRFAAWNDEGAKMLPPFGARC